MTRRITTELHTGDVIEDLEIDNTKDQDLHVVIPGGPKYTKTALYYHDRVSPWEITHGNSFPGTLIPLGAKVILKPAETKQEGTSKMEPSAFTGIFVGYELRPGCKWSGIGMVWPLDDFADFTCRPKVHDYPDK